MREIEQIKQGFLSTEYAEAASEWDVATCKRMAVHMLKFAIELQAVVHHIEDHHIEEDEEDSCLRN